MGINLAAKKRGWGYNYANSRLGAYVDGTEVLKLKSATITGASTYNVVEITITDEGTISSGSNKGIYLNYTNTGTKSGTSYCRGIHAEIDNTGTVSEVYCLCASVGSCSGTQSRIAGLRFYQSAVTGTCTNSTCLRLEHAGGATNNDYISMRKHGGTIRSIIANDATGHHYCTNFYYQAGNFKQPYYSSGCTVATGDTPYLRVLIESTAYGIPLFAV